MIEANLWFPETDISCVENWKVTFALKIVVNTQGEHPIFVPENLMA